MVLMDLRGGLTSAFAKIAQAMLAAALRSAAMVSGEDLGARAFQ